MAEVDQLSFRSEQLWVPLDTPVLPVMGYDYELGVRIGQENHIGFYEMRVLMDYLPDEVDYALDMLSNGGRFYNDHLHPEYATPECQSLRELIGTWFGGLRLVQRAFEAAHEDGKILDFEVNTRLTDRQGTTWGGHENHLVPRRIDPKKPYVFMPLVSHLATRNMLFGEGDFHKPDRFVRSQRARHIAQLIHDTTTVTKDRPLVNLRDEPHADKRYYRRIHITSGDPAESPMGMALRTGSTQWVLRLIQHGVDLTHLYLKDPVDAGYRVSYDEDMHVTLQMANNQRWKALEVQHALITKCRQLMECGIIVSDEERWVLDEWEKLVDTQLEKPDWRQLTQVAGYAAKLKLFEENPTKNRNQIDLQYGRLGPKGIAGRLRAAGDLPYPFGITSEEVEQYVTTPPKGRSRIRGRTIGELVARSENAWDILANWMDIWFINRKKNNAKDVLRMMDPYGFEPDADYVNEWIANAVPEPRTKPYGGFNEQS